MSESTEQPCPSMEVADDDSRVPKIDMVFESDEKAYHFYCLYGKEMGFGVRKHYVKRRSSGLVYSRIFCCYKEGVSKASKEGSNPRPDARTGCHAHITVRLMEDGRYRVSEFEPNHNHELVARAPEAATESTDGSEMALEASKKKVGRDSVARAALKSYKRLKCLTSAESVMRHVQKRAQGAHSDMPATSEGGTGNWVPSVDMEFEDDHEAHAFYINYAARTGFNVRKNLVKKRASGVVFSRNYCCHKEGYSKKVGNPKPRDRTGCPASMTIKITKNGRYRVTDFEPKHNHVLTIPTKANLLKWQWGKGLIKGPGELLDLVADRRVTPKHNEQVNGQEESCQHPKFLPVDLKNYIPSKRMNAAMVGDVGAVLQYMQEKQAEDPAFYYALQLDQDDRLANVFWTDVMSKVEFEYFDDVLTFDTSHTLNEYTRPFVQFIGVNHHKQAIIFGAALVYDETMESFKWLFEAFKTAMHGKQPKVILTDRSEAMSNAIAAVFPGTTHRLCPWQIYNNAAKHLNFVFQGSTTFTKDFSRCLYEIEEEEEFLKEWKLLLGMYDLHTNIWLAKLYGDREKWSLAYGRETFCADIISTLVKENMNSALKEYLDLGKNLFDFFKHYDSIVNQQRHAELQADFHARQSMVKVPALRMLKQVATAYTPAVFKMFQTEFDLSMDCMVFNCGQVGTVFEYKVTVDDRPKEYLVRFDSSDSTIFCSCKKFEFTGIQCRHVLKVLDIINIKVLPPQYILRRWTKDAKSVTVGSIPELAVDGDCRSSLAKRYGSLCSLLDKIAVKAAETMESHMFIENISDQLMDQVCKILQKTPPGRPPAS